MGVMLLGATLIFGLGTVIGRLLSPPFQLTPDYRELENAKNREAYYIGILELVRASIYLNDDNGSIDAVALINNATKTNKE